MPVVSNSKNNNPTDTSILVDNQNKHQRDMSVEDGPISRLSELNRNSVV